MDKLVWFTKSQGGEIDLKIRYKLMKTQFSLRVSEVNLKVFLEISNFVNILKISKIVYNFLFNKLVRIKILAKDFQNFRFSIDL